MTLTKGDIRRAEKSLYTALVDAGIETDSHESDLYFPVTDESRMILTRHYGEEANATIFTSQHDGKPWFDVPFAYSPFWDRKRRSD